jgi:predicted RNase H-like nuclease
MPDVPVVVGVDGCKAGWIAAVLDGDAVTAYFVEHIDQLLAAISEKGVPDVVAIDMPIGLPDSSTRQCDEQARRLLKGRASSVFTAPTRGAIESIDYATALVANRALTGNGFSKQAYQLTPKIREVDLWFHTAGVRVVEVHPELSFAALNGAPMPTGKKTWDGQQARRRLLEGVGIVIPDELGLAGRMAAPDDVLDAIVAAWSARRVALGMAECVPDPPEVFSDGIPAAIWF